LASPAVYVVLVTFERHAINDAGHWTRARILTCCRGALQGRKRQARDQRSDQTWPHQPRCN
jgi:hypothetical protein